MAQRQFAPISNDARLSMSRWIALVRGVSLSVLCLLAAESARAGVVFNANTAFAANELNPATASNSTFGPFTVGWGNTIPADGQPASPFTAFTAAEHTTAYGSSVPPSPGPNANTQGFATVIDYQVPAAVVNDLGATAGSGFLGLDPNEIMLHPGGRTASALDPPYYNGVLEFVAPLSGNFTIAGQFRSLDAGGTLNEIALNGTQVFSAVDPLNSGGAAYPFNFVEHLNAGDRVDFAVSANSPSTSSPGFGDEADSTGLFVTLTASSTPEPSSLLLLGLGALSLFAVGSRRLKGHFFGWYELV
jgi:hypothetical protein